MLIETPKWSYQPKDTVDPWGFSAYLYHDNVIGSWFSISTDGSVHWDRINRRADRIKAIVGNTLIATHSGKRGCHAFDIESGAHLWTYPKWSLLRKPTFPTEIDGELVVCAKGERLDVNSGTFVCRTPTKPDPFERTNLGETWIRDSEGWDNRSSLLSLVCGSDSGKAENVIAKRFNLKHSPPVGLQYLSERGEAWRIQFLDIAYAWRLSVNNTCLQYPYLFFVIPESSNRKKKTSGCRRESIPTTWRLLSFDLRSGTLVQDFRLGDDLYDVKIADATSDFILIIAWKRRRWSTPVEISLFEIAGSERQLPGNNPIHPSRGSGEL